MSKIKFVSMASNFRKYLRTRQNKVEDKNIELTLYMVGLISYCRIEFCNRHLSRYQLVELQSKDEKQNFAISSLNFYIIHQYLQNKNSSTRISKLSHTKYLSRSSSINKSALISLKKISALLPSCNYVYNFNKLS